MKKIIIFNIILLSAFIALYFYNEQNAGIVEIKTNVVTITTPDSKFITYTSPNKKINFDYPTELGDMTTEINSRSCVEGNNTNTLTFKNQPNLTVIIYPCDYSITGLTQLYNETYKSKSGNDVIVTTYTQNDDGSKYLILMRSGDSIYMNIQTTKANLSIDKKIITDLIQTLALKN